MPALAPQETLVDRDLKFPLDPNDAHFPLKFEREEELRDFMTLVRERIDQLEREFLGARKESNDPGFIDDYGNKIGIMLAKQHYDLRKAVDAFKNSLQLRHEASKKAIQQIRVEGRKEKGLDAIRLLENGKVESIIIPYSGLLKIGEEAPVGKGAWALERLFIEYIASQKAVEHFRSNTEEYLSLVEKTGYRIESGKQEVNEVIANLVGGTIAEKAEKSVTAPAEEDIDPWAVTGIDPWAAAGKKPTMKEVDIGEVETIPDYFKTPEQGEISDEDVVKNIWENLNELKKLGGLSFDTEGEPEAPFAMEKTKSMPLFGDVPQIQIMEKFLERFLPRLEKGLEKFGGQARIMNETAETVTGEAKKDHERTLEWSSTVIGAEYSDQQRSLAKLQPVLGTLKSGLQEMKKETEKLSQLRASLAGDKTEERDVRAERSEVELKLKCFKG